MNRLRTLIVEDEPEARRSLRDELARVEWIDVVGEAADGRTALGAIERLLPDLLFLDIRLPELDGLELLRRTAHAPDVVFTTAYDQHAVAAFEIGALDYLVKPFGRERLQQALGRIRSRLAPDPGVPAAAERARWALAAPLTRLFARHGERIVPIAVDDVRRFEACGDYARVHLEGSSFLLHVSLRELESRLDPERFVRLHRSHLVRLEAIAYLRPHDDRMLEAVLRDGSRVVASRSASERLRRLAR